MNLHKTTGNHFAYLFLCFARFTVVFSLKNNEKYLPDVTRYSLKLETDIKKEYIKGTERIDFLISATINKVIFDCGNLNILKVKGESVSNFKQENKKLTVFLNERSSNENQIQITYTGNPEKGLIFLAERDELYTVFSSSEWMVCNDLPNDRARFRIDLLIPVNKTCIASGTLTKKEQLGENVLYSWVQDYESPSYTYGFVIGQFNEVKEMHEGISLNYYSKDHDKAELKTIFKNTSDMIHFFEEKSAVKYIQKTYSQIFNWQSLSGNVWIFQF
jgi:aminopeptidase N